MSNKNLEQIIQQWKLGDKQAETLLYQVSYLQLHALAKQQRAKLAQGKASEQQVLLDAANSTTVLIHDAYLKLANSELEQIETHQQFYRMATKVMQQLMLDNARALTAQKRQANQTTGITESEIAEASTEASTLDTLIMLEQQLVNLEKPYPRQVDAFRFRYFMGLQLKEISRLLDCSRSLVEKDIQLIKALLTSQAFDLINQ